MTNAEKTVTKVFLIAVIAGIAALTYYIFTVFKHWLVPVIGIAIGVMIRNAVERIDEEPESTLTTEEKVVMIEKTKKGAKGFFDVVFPLLVVFMVIVSSSGGRKLIKKGVEFLRHQPGGQETVKNGGVFTGKNRHGEKIIYTLKDKKLEGAYRVYYRNGKLKEKWMYKDGKLDGKSLAYFKDGTIHRVQPYRNNKLHGRYAVYDGKGNLARENMYNMGVFHGFYREYYPGGKLKKEYIYENGKIESEKLYDLKGNVLKK